MQTYTERQQSENQLGRQKHRNSLAFAWEIRQNATMKYFRSSWTRKLCLFLIAVVLYYLLYFVYYYTIYTPGDCDVHSTGTFGLTLTDKTLCTLALSFNFLIEPFTLYDSSNYFYGIGLMFWTFATFIYTVLFLVAYYLFQLLLKKQKRAKK